MVHLGITTDGLMILPILLLALLRAVQRRLAVRTRAEGLPLWRRRVALHARAVLVAQWFYRFRWDHRGRRRFVGGQGLRGWSAVDARSRDPGTKVPER